MWKSTLIASFIVCSAPFLFCASAQAQTSSEVTLEPDHAVLLQSADREAYRRLKDLPDAQQKEFSKIAGIAYDRLRVAIRRDTASSFAIPQEFSELSCGLNADSVAIGIKCTHGFYYCYVQLSSEGGISAGCGKDTPVPATQVDP